MLPKMRFHFPGVSSLLWPFVAFTCLVLIFIKQFGLIPTDRNLLNPMQPSVSFLNRTQQGPHVDINGNYSENEWSIPGIYNLLEDAIHHSNALVRPTKECTQEFMNYNRLQQDHPCVINFIRRHYLKEPPPLDVPLNLDYPEVRDPSDGQPNTILDLLRNKKNGFFIECGALDGENLSNTLYMERFFNWTGILIEADQDSFTNLLSRKRKAWSLPVCLSLKPYPTKVTFQINYALGQIVGVGLPKKNLTGKTSSQGRDIEVQCFPLYSILLAVGRVQVDFFSLDVEGHELLVLKTIPFDKVNIKTLTVEWTGGEMAHMGKEPIRKFMENNGYATVSSNKIASDLLFIRNV